MKTIKNLFACMLSLIVTLQLIVPAHAIEGTINMSNAVIRQTYSIYQILNVESYDDTQSYFSYKVNDEWLTFINKKTIKDVYVTINNGGYVNWIEGADVKKFASLAIEYAKDNHIAPTASLKANDSSITFNNLSLGYYLIDTTVGTLCTLTTTSPSVSVIEKNSDVSVVKEVLEDSTKVFSTYNDAQIDETMTFKVTIHPSDGALNYVLHDEMAEGLSFDKVTSVMLNDEYIISQFFKIHTDDCCEQCDFEISFDKYILDQLTDDDVITVEYTAHLNYDAVVSNRGNENKAYVSYGQNNDLRSNEDTTLSYCWNASIYKMTYRDGNKVPLANAVFQVFNEEDDRMLFSLVSEGVYRVDEEGDYDTITTDDTGLFYIEGLDEGNYSLKEIEAPAGYNILNENVELVITRGTFDETGLASYQVPLIEVENNTGAQMPETGGVGTTLFYSIGGGLTLLSAIMMIVKKKMSYES